MRILDGDKHRKRLITQKFRIRVRITTGETVSKTLRLPHDDIGPFGFSFLVLEKCVLFCLYHLTIKNTYYYNVLSIVMVFTNKIVILIV